MSDNNNKDEFILPDEILNEFRELMEQYNRQTITHTDWVISPITPKNVTQISVEHSKKPDNEQMKALAKLVVEKLREIERED